MTTAAIITLVVVGLLALGAVALLTASRKADVRGAGSLSRETTRRDKDAEIDGPQRATAAEVEAAGQRARVGTAVATVAPSVPQIWVPPTKDVVAMNRRQFLNRANITLMSASLGAFAAASFAAFLWPFKTAGFGGKVSAGKLDEIIAGIRANRGFLYNSTARSYLTQYPSEALPKARGVSAYKPVLSGMEAGLVALYQKCPHLGCRVPQCETSQWFECPCHGSQYNRVGEKKGGPAPRGMDHFTVTVSATGDVTIDTATPFAGAPIGTNTTGQEAEGPHCVTGGGGH